jgi:hypothetical protein
MLYHSVRLNNLAQWAYDRFSEEKSKCGFTIPRDTVRLITIIAHHTRHFVVNNVFMVGWTQPYESLYGVYSETKDGLPFVGTLRGSDRVCYLLGCNARGQVSISVFTTNSNDSLLTCMDRPP